jgi:uncharacterized protein
MNNYNRFKEKLDNNHDWPSVYMFKFIVPSEKEEEINKLFPKKEIKSRFSKNRKYIGITAEIVMRSSDDVIQVYVKAHKVDGVIAL